MRWAVPVLGAVLALAASTELAAQSRIHELVPGDTLRYVESSTWRTMVGAPSGEVPASRVREATIALTSDSAGSWRAWYDEFEIRVIRFGGVVEPNREFLMGRPFVLEVSPVGDVELVEPPTILRAFSELWDPTLQFVDFFVSVPARDLAVGATWSDTVASPDLGGPSTLRAVRRMTLVGDTTVNGTEAAVVEVVTETSYESTQRVPGWEAKASTSLVGSERGIVILDLVRGVMLHRTREGEMQGTLASEGLEIPHRVRYESEITARPDTYSNR